MRVHILLYSGTASYDDFGVAAIWNHEPTKEDYLEIAESLGLEDHNIRDLMGIFGKQTTTENDTYFKVQIMEI